MRTAVLKGKNLHTPLGSFTCPSGLVEADEEGVTIFAGDVPRGMIIARTDEIMADIWDQRGTRFLETFQVLSPRIKVKLQEKSHTLPKGGQTTQYTVTIPRSIVETLGWKKMDRIWVSIDSEAITLTRREDREQKHGAQYGILDKEIVIEGDEGYRGYGYGEGRYVGCRT